MAARKFGYACVSIWEQNPERQNHILWEGDLLVVTELKRFRRNCGKIYKEWFHITKEIGADIKATSMPILDTAQSKELVGQLIKDAVLAVFAYVADGKHLGRPRVEYSENWEECYGRWKGGVVSAKEAMILTELKKNSFYRLVKKYESQMKDAEEEKL